MRKKILEDFRDKVIGLTPGRPGAAQSIVVFAGKADPEVAEAVRNSLDESTILFYLYPGNAVKIPACGKGGTLFSSLEEDAFPHEKAGILLSLRPDKNVCLKVDNSLEVKYQQTIAKINEAIESALSNAEQSRIGNLIYLRSSICNLRPLFSSPHRMLKNNDPSVPAVICCGGPSFSNALPLLKEYNGKIAIFSMARTSSTLVNEGIMPDIVVHTDPFYDISWTEKAAEKKCLLAAALSVYPTLASKFENIIWFSGDSASVNNYARDTVPGLLNEIVISKTVTVSAIDLAIKAGFKKIILTGSDLCLSIKGKSHVNDSSICSASLLQIDGNSGEKVFTTRELESLRKGLESYLGTQIPDDVKIYNCTKGGALIKNIPHVALDEFLTKNAAAEKNISLETSKDNQLSIFNDIASGLKKIIGHTDSMISAAEALYCSIQHGQTEEIRQCQNLLNKLIALKPEEQNAFEYFRGDIEEFLDNTMNSLPELRLVNLEEPLTKLVLFIKRSLLEKDLCRDILSDIEKTANNARRFVTFRNFALRFIAAGNQGFAEYLDKLDLDQSPFRMDFSLQNLPNIVKLKENGKILFSYAVSEHIERACEFANTLAEKHSFDPGKDALIFPAPVNYLNIVETARRYPLSDMMIIEIWPEFLNQLISSAMFFHEVPEKTIVAGPDDLDGLAASTIKRWESSGKMILIINTPEASGTDEADSLRNTLKNIL